MDESIQSLIAECKRQEESCLYMSTTIFEWLKSLRCWRIVFVIVPIILGAIATAPIVVHKPGFEWLTATCALFAGIIPAIYKALNLDVGLEELASHAHQFKILQDRFRQAWRITAHGRFEEFKAEFTELMDRMDSARSSSLTAPERFFKKAQRKIKNGHYDFGVDQN